jgi:hypothetical protein
LKIWDGITALCTFDGPINDKGFRACVEQLLLSALRQEDIVVLDSLVSHVVDDPELLERTGRGWRWP